VTCAGCHHHCTFTKSDTAQDMASCPERAIMLSARVSKLIAMRRAEHAERKVAIVLFNFPPNAGNIGTAAYLAVFESLYNTLAGMKAQGYTIDMPESIDALRESVLKGNAEQHGADANVHVLIKADDHVRRERWLNEIEAQWGPAPGKQLSNGSSIFVLGKQFGNVLVSVQPAFGYEGDPMRLLFEKGLAPTHAFSAFYRYLREDFKAHAVLHFGTHGALEFMPGKQAGMSGTCWPDRMIDDLPNLYLYASNNPSEGAIAKRRSGATLISYLTPPVAQAGLYSGLTELKSSIDSWRGLPPSEAHKRADLAVLIQSQAAELDLLAAAPLWSTDVDARILALGEEILELEYTLIPHGLHVTGQACSEPERIDMLMAMAESSHPSAPSRESIESLVAGDTAERALSASGLAIDDVSRKLFASLAESNRLLSQDHEVGAILAALDGRFIRPSPGGDILHTADVLPTGRNIHGFDPFRIPSTFAMRDGAAQAQRLLDTYVKGGNSLPETIAMVLWGSDNLKSEGGPLAQALALMGAMPRFDSYGRIAGATLVPIEELGRPRIDVMVTISGIFRDLMPLQIKLLAEAAYMAATADEAPEMNFIRKHALAYQREHGCTLEIASLRVYGNAEGAYGSNVNNLVESSRWAEEDELAETYSRRKGFAYGRGGRAVQQSALLQSVLSDVQLTYQNLDWSNSVSPPSTTISIPSAASPARSSGLAAARPRRSSSAIRLAAKAPFAHSKIRWRSKPARACSTRNGSKACSSMATRVCVRSRFMSPTPWAGRRRPVRSSPGSTSSYPKHSCSIPRCVNGWPSSTPPRPRVWPIGCSRLRSVTTGRPNPKCWRPCEEPARNSKTGSKAFTKVPQHDNSNCSVLRNQASIAGR
jgi:magnesium chelatase subunit H